MSPAGVSHCSLEESTSLPGSAGTSAMLTAAAGSPGISVGGSGQLSHRGLGGWAGWRLDVPTWLSVVLLAAGKGHQLQ